MLQITLKAARINAGLTQMDVVNRTGISRSTLHRWENGKGAPKLNDLRTLCELYQVPMDCIKQE